MKTYWNEKEKLDWNDRYDKKGKIYYNRNGWGVEALIFGEENLEAEIKEEERDVKDKKKHKENRRVKI